MLSITFSRALWGLGYVPNYFLINYIDFIRGMFMGKKCLRDFEYYDDIYFGLWHVLFLVWLP